MRRFGTRVRAATGFVAVAVTFVGLPVNDAFAAHGTPEALATAEGLSTFAAAMDQLAGTPEFAAKLPLTDRSPADILGFPGVFTRTLAGDLAGFDGDYAALRTAIEGASSTADGITYTVPTGIVVAGDEATFTVHVVLRREQHVKISYVRQSGSPEDPDAVPPIVVRPGSTGGTVPVTMTLTADFPFRMNKALTAPGPGGVGTVIDRGRALALQHTGASMTLTTGSATPPAGSSATGLAFSSRFGFSDVSVTGAAAFNLTGRTTFSDPDADGSVSQYEWLTTLFGDWAAFDFTDSLAGDDVNVALTFDSTLITGTADDGTVTYRDAGAPTYVDLRPTGVLTSPSVPVVAMTNLEPFARIGADDALTGLSQFAAALAGAQAKIDIPLPLLDTRFSDAFRAADGVRSAPADELQTLVEHQGSAAIVCGKANTSPPSAAELEGTTWYCQAITKDAVNAGSISWAHTEGTGAALTGGAAATTVGPAPTTNVMITGVVGEPDVSVSFSVTQQQANGTSATQTFTAKPRIRSAQELNTVLAAIPGSTISMAYDRDRQALTYGVRISKDPAPMAAGFDVGDALRLGTGLSGLELPLPAQPTAAQRAPVSVDVGETVLDATYGLLLQPNIDALAPDPINGSADRYFVKPGSGAEISVASIAVTTPSPFKLTGKVGYLGVDADGTGSAWTISKPVSGNAALRADLDITGTLAAPTPHTVSPAMLLRTLLDTPTALTSTFNLALTARLVIDPNGNLSSISTGSGTPHVDVAWPDWGRADVRVDPNDAFDDYLRPFDILPLAQGVNDRVTKSTVTLTDASADFFSDFGATLEAADPVPGVLINVTTGATCSAATIVSATELACNVTGQGEFDASPTSATTPVLVTGMTGGNRLTSRAGTGTSATFRDADNNTVTTASVSDNHWRTGDVWRVAGDPDVMGTLLLENLYEVANRLDKNANVDYRTPLPMIGLTPQELTPQFAAIADAVTAITARVPLAGQASVWAPTTAYAAGALVQPGTPNGKIYRAKTAGTSGATEPTWSTSTDTTDATGSALVWAVQDPTPLPPATLQEMLSELDDQIDATTDPSGRVTLGEPVVSLSLTSIDRDPSGSTETVHAQLLVEVPGTGTIDAPVRLELTDMSALTLRGLAPAGGLVGAVDVTTASTATIRFAVPLSPDMPAGDVLVRGDTGVSALSATADSSTVDFTGNAGSMALAMGTSATLFGTHKPLTGTHTADPSYTQTPYVQAGTATTGSTASTLKDTAGDFVAKGVTAGATITEGTNTCTVSAVVDSTTLTCPLDNSATWASGEAYTLRQDVHASVLSSTSLDFRTLGVGDKLVVTSAGANSGRTCTLTAVPANEKYVLCPVSGGTWTSGETFTVNFSRTMTDGDRVSTLTTAAADVREFTTYLSSGLAPPDSSITNTTSNKSCPVLGVTATTVVCSLGTRLSSDGTWVKNDAYRFDIGSPTRTLVDPGAGFDTMSLPGRTIRNRTDGTSCVVSSANRDTVTCAAALVDSGGAASGKWDAGDQYELSGPGVMKFDLDAWTLSGSEGSPVDYTSAGNLAGSPIGPLAALECTTPSTTDTAGDTCALLGAQLVDPDAVQGTVASVTTGVITATATSPARSLVTEGPKSGSVVRNVTKQFTCVVGTVTATTFTCPSTGTWAAADAWRVDEGAYLGVLTYHADVDDGTSDAGGLGPAFAAAAVDDEPMEFSLLTAALDMLKGYVEDTLEGTVAAEPFPLIGLDRTAGSHVMEAFGELEDYLVSNAPPELTAGMTPDQFKNAIADYMTAAVVALTGAAGGRLAKIMESSIPGEVGSKNVSVTMLCKTSPSAAAHDCSSTGQNVGGVVIPPDGHEHISDVRVRLTIGGDAAKSLHVAKGCKLDTCENVKIALPRFSAGLPGLELDGPGGLQSQAGWTFDVDFGLARDVGPYLGTNPTPTNPADKDPELEIGASVLLPDTETGCTATLPENAGPNKVAQGTGTNPKGFTASRCYKATLGLLQGIIFDGTGSMTDDSAADGTTADRTGLELRATMDLKPGADTSGRISLDDLTASDIELPTFKASATGNIDLYFVTGITAGGDPVGTSLPSVQGTVHLGFNLDDQTLRNLDAEETAFTDVSYDDLMMDSGSFVRNFLAPIVDELAKLTKPFKTLADILMAPIPVLEQIARMTGQKIGSLLEILEQAAAKPLGLIRSVLGFISLVADMANKAGNTLIALGSGVSVTEKGGFRVGAKDTRQGPCGKTVDGAKQPKDCKKSFKANGTKYKQSVVQLKPCASSGCTGKELTRTMTKSTKVTKFDGMGITFPFMNDTSAIFGLLVGEHATLVRFDPGAFGVSAGLSYSWGPFMAGPVPIEITIGATISLTAHFAIGYDTRGIYNMLKQDRDNVDANALADGIFIDDLDLAGNDVDEIQLTVVFTIGASVSVSIFKVGLYGGVGITIGFDLVDPDNDGKLYIDELEQFKDNPICLFKVRGLLDFFLGFFVEIDLKFWTKRWDVELFRLKPPITLFETQCERKLPTLAVVNATTKQLRLNIGDVTVGTSTYATNRNYKTTRVNEKFVVRPIEAFKPDAGNRVLVEFSNLIQEYTVPQGGTIIADAGSGNDVIELASGVAEDGNTPIAFQIPADIAGGSGDDQITTGAGNDSVIGSLRDGTAADADADKIITMGGDDTVEGGPGKDNIDGGLGQDVLDGEAGDDRVVGNAGADYVAGGPGVDTVTGGPGLDAAQRLRAMTRNPLLTAAEADLLLDGNDVLVGGDGADTLSGHFGDDVVFGAGQPAITTTAPSGVTDARRRVVQALDGTVVVGHATGTLTFATACVAAGDAADGGDQVNGEAGDDVLVGGAGDDRMAGAGGADQMCGGTGHDLVEGDNATASTGGDDVLAGGDGNDEVLGRKGADVADGGAGADLVDGGEGNDKLTGGAGTDAIDAGLGSDIVLGDGGTIPTTTPAITTSGSQVRASVTSDPTSDSTVGTTPITCLSAANVLTGGLLDLDGDGSGSEDGRVLGRKVTAGRVKTESGANFNGTIGDLVVADGLVQGGAASLAGATMTVAGASSDCILAGAGHDAVFAGPGDDVVLGGVGLDYLQGDAGADFLRGYQDADTLDGGADSDALYGDTGADVVSGGSGDDELHGGIHADVVHGNDGADRIFGEDDADVLVGGSATAGVADGADTINGGPGNDVLAGDNALPNAARTGVTLHDLATPGLFSGGDVLDGKTGADRLYGQGGADTLHGNEDADHLEGNGGADSLFGDAGADALVGGTGADGVPDAGDTLRGGADADVLAGDNAQIAATAVTLLDVPFAGTSPSAAAAGGDTAFGEDGADRIYGQSGGDTLHGDVGDTGTGADYVEGGAGDDVVHGGGGNDRLVGGSGVDEGEADGLRELRDVHDGNDTINGHAGADLVVGDNALVTVAGVITLYDVDVVGATAPSSLVSGADTVLGGVDDDRIHGQGANDTLSGDAGADSIEGNSGGDEIFGNAGNDRLVGGSGAAGRRDDGLRTSGVNDRIVGGDGVDAIAGDNATISASQAVALLDLRVSGTTAGDEAGPDQIFGDTSDGSGAGAADVLYGQSGADEIHGGAAGDYIEGNAGADTVNGDDGDDRVVGGSGQDSGGTAGAQRQLRNMIDSGDALHGDAGQDVVTGDNALITTAGVVTLYDEDISGGPAASPDISGDDTISGDADTDVLYGQGGNDTMSGGTDDDLLEGNTGRDTMTGDDGADNLVGGSTNNATVRDGAVVVGGVSRGDEMSGGTGIDVMLGDNGVVKGAGGTATWSLYDLDTAGGAAPASDLSGPDSMSGNAGTDRMAGQGGDDTMSGGADDDLAQGNSGADAINGNAGADDLVGGGSHHHGSMGNEVDLAGRSDSGDTINGDDSAGSAAAADGSDAVVGDNGRIVRGSLDANTGDAAAAVTLYDVDVVGVTPTPHADTAGADTIRGDADRDYLLGGGGIDDISGNAGDDYIEGNAAGDVLAGDAGRDDIVGGGSALGTAKGAIRLVAPAATAALTATGLADGADTITGGDGSDAVIGDNGVIARVLAGGLWQAHVGNYTDIVKRVVQVPVASESAGAYGNDTVNGGDGHDELHGELGNDAVSGDDGDDSVVGDLGRLTLSVNGSNGKAQQVITDKGGFLSETVHSTGTLQRDATMYDFTAGGTDQLDGGKGNDTIHAGANDDTAYGNRGAQNGDLDIANVCASTVTLACDRDVIFGGNGDDWMWGGPDKDHMYGGYGSDHLDVVRPGTPQAANAIARFTGPDVMYGGWQQDAMQADTSSPNPNTDDKMIDSTGVYNVYYVCEGAYGGSSIVRSPSPSLIATVQAMALADGATAVTTRGSAGFNELSVVFTNEFSANSSPAFLDSPGHFTCT